MWKENLKYSHCKNRRVLILFVLFEPLGTRRFLLVPSITWSLCLSVCDENLMWDQRRKLQVIKRHFVSHLKILMVEEDFGLLNLFGPEVKALRSLVITCCFAHDVKTTELPKANKVPLVITHSRPDTNRASKTILAIQSDLYGPLRTVIHHCHEPVRVWCMKMSTRWNQLTCLSV